MEKINKLINIINNHNLDGYIIPKNDEFFSEYISKEKDCLKFISNFSGSYGFAIILKDKNYLFVDGRYTQQAKIQSGSYFNIQTIPHKMPGDILKKKQLKIGFCSKLFTENILKKLFRKSKCNLVAMNKDLISMPKKKNASKKIFKSFLLNEKQTGEIYKKKINKLSKILIKRKIDIQFISASENIAWLLNIRGGDSNFSPILNSYLIMEPKKKFIFFCDLKKISTEIKKKLKNIKILDIKYIESFLKNIKKKKIQIDSASCSIYFKNILKKDNSIIEITDPIYLLKSIKNKIEINNTIKSHVYDGAALTKFLFWIKKNYKKSKITEISAQNKLLKFRKMNKTFQSLSFPTISGCGPNGSIIHYKAEKKSNRLLSEGDIYLIDSGGQYKFGTTDVTRTISLNNKDRKIKDIFTRVLKCHITVANFKLRKNTSGSEIDLVARSPLRKINLDYAHGTGHGVGYYLNVHEGPQSISRGNKVILKKGMIISNEPGFYQPNKFGIRIENLIFIKKINKKLKFENLTMAPIDRSLINKSLLNNVEKIWLNKYHRNVFQRLKKFMDKEELKELKKSCSNI